MKYWIASIGLTALLVTSSIAAKGPEVRVIDNRVSMDVESISLSQLLQLFDRATGLQSTVPAALSNRSVSVKFADLSFDDAVRKIFEGQPLDYVVIDRQGIVVTALSQTGGPEPSSAPAYNAAPPQIEQPSFVEDNQPPPFVPAQPPPAPVASPFPGAQGGQTPFNQQQNPAFNQQQTQPAVIQTPFGPIPNPRAGQPVPGGQAPAQATPFGTTTPFGASTPFGNAAPVGGQPPVNQNNNVFGNTSPPMFNQNQK
jgi:hypothetical protein